MLSSRYLLGIAAVASACGAGSGTLTGGSGNSPDTDAHDGADDPGGAADAPAKADAAQVPDVVDAAGTIFDVAVDIPVDVPADLPADFPPDLAPDRPDDLPVDAPPACVPPCKVGDKRCGAGGGLQICALNTTSMCAAWVAEVACGANRTCGGSAPNAACTCNSTCLASQVGTYCKNGTTLATCTADTSAAPTCYVSSGDRVCAGELPCTGSAPTATCGNIPHVFVIAMENKDTSQIYGNTDVPYINNTLMVQGGHAANYSDILASGVPSEPHYVWLEAGTNTFADATFSSNADPSKANSTADGTHIAAKLAAAGTGKTWRSYQEGLGANTGACPIISSGFYAAKHDPFVFFQDVAGNPPSATNALCAAHHRAYTASGFQADLAAHDVAAYTFITPDLCHAMHGDPACANGCVTGSESACFSAADAWLATIVPPVTAYINAHGGVLFIVWDEPDGGTLQPFLVIGPNVKAKHTSTVSYTHSSYVKSIEKILGLPVNRLAAGANDFSDFFTTGKFP